MTVAELMRHNFDEIFIELDPVKREDMMRNAYTEDCVWIHPGGRLVGIAAINKSASEIRKSIPEYRYTVIGDIQTMHNVGTCHWGSGPPGQAYRYTWIRRENGSSGLKRLQLGCPGESRFRKLFYHR